MRSSVERTSTTSSRPSLDSRRRALSPPSLGLPAVAWRGGELCICHVPSGSWIKRFVVRGHGLRPLGCATDSVVGCRLGNPEWTSRQSHSRCGCTFRSHSPLSDPPPPPPSSPGSESRAPSPLSSLSESPLSDWASRTSPSRCRQTVTLDRETLSREEPPSRREQRSLSSTPLRVALCASATPQGSQAQAATTGPGAGRGRGRG
eukprot:1169495-Rhodomonas_salina.1